MSTFDLQPMSLILLDFRGHTSDDRLGSEDRKYRPMARNAGELAHFLESGLREQVIEHLFVGDLLRCLWRHDVHDIEILRAEVDRAGYDLVLECNGILRHVQLKASYRSAKTSRVSINSNLSRKLSGCVIWIWFDPDTLDLGPFRWFGGSPGTPLPPLGDRVGRHTKGDRRGQKSERPNIRVIRKGQFTVLAEMDEVAKMLFGELI